MKRQRVIIYGKGKMGEILAGCLDHETVEILGFIDKNTDIGGGEYRIYGIPEAIALDPDYIFISSSRYEKEMVSALLEHGWEKEIIRSVPALGVLGRLLPLFTEKGYIYMNTLYMQNRLQKAYDNVLHTKKARYDNIQNDASWNLLLNTFAGLAGRRSGSERIRIMLITLEDEENIPDRIIAVCTKYLIEKAFRQNWKELEYEIITNDMRRVDFAALSGCDCCIFAGGGLIRKYSNYIPYAYLLKRIIETADTFHIPVMFNAVGVEECDEISEFITLKKAVNMDCVKMITVRDDMELLKASYLTNPDIITEKVADPCWWADEVYADVQSRRTETIGVGLIHVSYFSKNGMLYGDEGNYYKFYRELFEELDRRKLPWVLFTDGAPQDYKADFLMDFRLKTGYPDLRDKLLPRPGTDIELIKMLTSFKGVVAPRLHANIIPYAFGIPGIAVIWHKKVEFFGEVSLHPERVFHLNECSGAEAIRRLVEAFGQDDTKHKEMLRNRTLEYLERFLRMCIQEK